jgi:hypothetical protein
MNIGSFKRKIEREAEADVDAILDNAQSGAIVEKHINGISFGLWTLVAILVVIATLAIIFRAQLGWNDGRHFPTSSKLVPHNPNENLLGSYFSAVSSKA